MTPPTVAELAATLDVTILEFTAFLSWLPPKRRGQFTRRLDDARAVLARLDPETQVIVDAEMLAHALEHGRLRRGGPGPGPAGAGPGPSDWREEAERVLVALRKPG